MAPHFEKDKILNLIHQNLNEMLNGQSALGNNIQVSDYSNLPDNAEVLSNFIELLAGQWMNTCKNGANKSSESKQLIVKMIFNEIDFIIDAISAFKSAPENHGNRLTGARGQDQNDPEEVPELNPIGSESVNEHTIPTDVIMNQSQVTHHMEADGPSGQCENDSIDRSGADKAMRSKKKAKARKPKRGKEARASQDNYKENQDGPDILDISESQSILESIPLKVRRDFKQIGFTMYVGRYQPILQVGPYDIAAVRVQKQWFDMFKEKKRQKKPLQRLVYWYGTEVKEAFSFIPGNKIVSYENGVKRGLDKIPPNIQRKLDGNKPLNGTEKTIVTGLSDMEEDEKLPLEERAYWLLPEDQSEGEVSSISCASDGESDEGGADGSGCAVALAVAAASKPKKNSRKRSIPDDCEYVDDENDQHDKLPTRSSLDTTRKINKKKRIFLDEDDEEEDQNAPSFDFRVCLKPKNSKKGMKAMPKSRIFALTVSKEDEVLMEEEIEIEKIVDGKLNKMIHYENVHLNLTFNLEM